MSTRYCFALKVLDERQLGNLLVAGLVNDDGNLLEPEALDCPQTALTGNEFVAPLHHADDERLDEPALANRVGQLADLLFVEASAGLKGRGENLLRLGADDALAVRLRPRRRFAGRLGVIAARDQSAESFS